MMTTQSFHELTDQLEQELIRLHYTDASIKQYRRMWRRIATFFEQEDINYYTEEAGLRFLDEQFNFFEKEREGKLTQSLINTFRIIRMLGDFQQHGSILRRYYKHKQLLQTNEHVELLQNYQNYCLQKEYAKATQKHYRKITEKFLSFIESQDIRQCTDITAKHISDYINTLLGYSYKTVELELCGLHS